MLGILFLFLLAIAHVSLPYNSVIAVNLEKGFSIKMIHRDSKESPFYPGDHLTRDERLQRLVQQSKVRARYIESQILLHSNATSSMNSDVPRLPVVYEPRMYYVAMVGLGTFPGKRQSFMSYYFIVDTGNDRTWLQCAGATKNFTQDVPLYPWYSSTTYRPVPCNNPYCQANGGRCGANGQCTYISTYESGPVTYGIVAEEKFTLSSDTGGLKSIQLYMGCGFRQENFEIGNNHLHGKPDLIAGILGLGSGPFSFLTQLGVVGQGKFSYCFETFNTNIEGSDIYIRFGTDATIEGDVRTTPIVLTWFPTFYYYLYLEDISVGNIRVNFPRGTFKLSSEGEGGTVIDSGTPISHMYKDHFDRVANLVKAHFSNLGIEYIGSYEHFDVCFRLDGKFDISNYPSITLHFRGGAEYVIPDYKANFIIIGENVCLLIFREDSNTPAFILGANQQTNKRILYDVKEKSLSFASEYCELGS